MDITISVKEMETDASFGKGAVLAAPGTYATLSKRFWRPTSETGLTLIELMRQQAANGLVRYRLRVVGEAGTEQAWIFSLAPALDTSNQIEIKSNGEWKSFLMGAFPHEWDYLTLKGILA